MAGKTLDSYKEFDQIRVNSWKIILFEKNIYNIVSIYVLHKIFFFFNKQKVTEVRNA